MDSKNLIVNTDGGARGNPGPAGIGVSISAGKKELMYLSKYIGEKTNNEAEYLALVEAIKHLNEKKLSPTNIKFLLDSELVVKQVTGIYKVKKPHLMVFIDQITHELSLLKQRGCQNISFKHVPRALNKRADQLVNQALDEKLNG